MLLKCGLKNGKCICAPGGKNIQIKHLFILSKPLVDVIFEYEINKLRTT